MHSHVCLRATAREFSLTLENQTGTSMLNILLATVAAIADLSPAHVTMRLLPGRGTGAGPHYTQISLATDLKPGKPVYTRVKILPCCPDNA